MEKEEANLIGGKSWLKDRLMRVAYLLFFLSFAFGFAANAKDDLSCDSPIVISKIEDFVISGKSNEKTIAFLRQQKLFLRNINKFEQIDNFNGDIDAAVSDEVLMLGINEGVEDYVVCKNGVWSFLLYEKDLMTYAKVFRNNRLVDAFFY